MFSTFASWTLGLTLSNEKLGVSVSKAQRFSHGRVKHDAGEGSLVLNLSMAIRKTYATSDP
jgi:hypothetical protein